MSLSSARRSLEIGSVVTTTFTVFRAAWLPLFVSAVIFHGLPIFVLVILQGRLPPVAGITVSRAVLIIVNWFVFFSADAVLQGAVSPMVADVLASRRASFSAAMRASLQNLLPLIGVSLLVGLGVFLGFLLLVFPGLLLLTRWVVAAPALVVERCGVRQAIDRSQALTNTERWRVLLLILLNFGIATAISVASYRLQVLIAPLHPGYAPSYVLALVTDSLASMISATGIAVLYVALRRIEAGVAAAELSAVFD